MEPGEGSSRDSRASRSAAEAVASKPSAETGGASAPRLLFSGIDVGKTELAQMKKIGATLVSDSVKEWKTATHLIAGSLYEDPKIRLKRRPKVLVGISSVPHILDKKWLNESATAKRPLNEEAYILHDPEYEAELGGGFSLAASVADDTKILAPYAVFVLPGTEGIPPNETVCEIVECAGGEFLSRLPSKAKARGSLIVIGSADGAKKNKAALAVAREGLGLFEPELLLRGVMCKNLDFERFRIDA